MSQPHAAQRCTTSVHLDFEGLRCLDKEKGLRDTSSSRFEGISQSHHDMSAKSGSNQALAQGAMFCCRFCCRRTSKDESQDANGTPSDDQQPRAHSGQAEQDDDVRAEPSSPRSADPSSPRSVKHDRFDTQEWYVDSQWDLLAHKP